MSITVKRTKDDEYKLLVDGSVVKTYQQTKMKHPKDWADDAINAGAPQFHVLNHSYDYVDDR